MVDEHLQNHGTTGHLLKHPTSGHLIKNCAGSTTPIPCDDCKNDGPITCTLTTTGGCNEVDTDCDYDCTGAVFNLDDMGGSNWLGDTGIPSGGTDWSCEIQCTADVWTITVEGGCGSSAFANVPKWTAVVFVPTGCATSGEPVVGYPTHAGIALGNPTTNGDCWTDCVPTVALS